MNELDEVIEGVKELRDYADSVIHQIVSPDNWSVYSRLRDLIDETDNKALALLKAQEPRVLTLKELWNVGRVWESSAPPYLWLDKNRSIYNTISFWCAWRDIYEMIHGRHDKYTDENYGSEWRVWNLKPTPEQMRDTKWEEK